MAHVLVVEDNPANLKLVAVLLERAGHEVLVAVDGESAVSLAHEHVPDLVLMDVQLPGMDGLAATALLKADPKTCAIPIIALTAMAMKDDQARARTAGCDAWIAKPLRYRELYEAIDRLIGAPA